MELLQRRCCSREGAAAERALLQRRRYCRGGAAAEGALLQTSGEGALLQSCCRVGAVTEVLLQMRALVQSGRFYRGGAAAEKRRGYCHSSNKRRPN